MLTAPGGLTVEVNNTDAEVSACQHHSLQSVNISSPRRSSSVKQRAWWLLPCDAAGVMVAVGLVQGRLTLADALWYAQVAPH